MLRCLGINRNQYSQSLNWPTIEYILIMTRLMSIVGGKTKLYYVLYYIDLVNLILNLCPNWANPIEWSSWADITDHGSRMHCSAAWEAENRKMDHVGSAGTTYCTPLIVGKNATSIITYIQYIFFLICFVFKGWYIRAFINRFFKENFDNKFMKNIKSCLKFSYFYIFL